MNMVKLVKLIVKPMTLVKLLNSLKLEKFGTVLFIEMSPKIVFSEYQGCSYGIRLVV